jgi:hypothetical protein
MSNKKTLLTFALIAAVSLGTAYAQTGFSASPAHSYILAMAESGGSVYLAGPYNDGYKDIACYWQDGIKTNLPAGNSYSYATAITTSNNSIYLAGNYSDGSKTIACYWQNGRKTDLPAPAGPFEIAAARAPVVIPITITITGIDTVKYGGWDCGVYLYNDTDKMVGHAYRKLVSSSLTFSMLEWVDDIVLTKPDAYSVMFQLGDIKTREKTNDTAYILSH